MKFLITGDRSGLGRYLFENFGGTGWDRDISEEQKKALNREGADVIVHCAFNPTPEVTSETLFSYLQDNLFLAKELTAVPHKKFIFISSVDVYPKNKTVHREDEVINVNEVEGIYGVTKLMAESIVKEYCSNYLLMRCSAFLGPYMRKNNLKKILEDVTPVITLTQDSELNVVRYEDVLEFLKVAVEKDLGGIYNIASCANIKLAEVASLANKHATFGEYRYQVGKINNAKAALVVSAFKKTSQEIIKEFGQL